MIKIDFLKVYKSKKYGEYKVIKDLGSYKVLIEFISTGYRYEVSRQNAAIGVVKDKNLPVIFGVGFTGVGAIKKSSNGVINRSYRVWYGMLARCYDRRSRLYHRYGGRGVSVCDEWFNYQVFGEWYNKQKNSYVNGFCLDKDLKNIGAKMYSPENCEIIPNRVNVLLTSSNKRRGKCPVGVSERRGKYRACGKNWDGQEVYLGVFDCEMDAFNAYRNFKSSVIRKVAEDEFKKGNISKGIYDNLLNFNITPFPE